MWNVARRTFHVNMTYCKCGKPSSKSHRYCPGCKAAYEREWRKTHPLTRMQRRKLNARSYAHVYLKRGKIVKEPCRICGSVDSEMHHPNYRKPTLVHWYCRPCHLAFHKKDDLA